MVKPVSVVIPAYNEEAGVREQVENVRRVLNSQGIVHEIVVIDDGSRIGLLKKPSNLKLVY